MMFIVILLEVFFNALVYIFSCVFYCFMIEIVPVYYTVVWIVSNF